jgi:hypothetical protein
MPGFFSSTPFLFEYWSQGTRQVWANVRYVNYRIDERGCYHSNEKNEIITRNRLFRLQAGPEFYLEVEEEKEIIDASGTFVYNHQIQGQEDLRLFATPPQGSETQSGPLQFLAVDAQANAQNVICLIWGQLNEAGEITQRIPLRVQSSFQVEKNWTPFWSVHPQEPEGKPEWFLIYSFAPLRIYRLAQVLAYSQEPCDAAQAPCPLAYQADLRPDENLSTFRGGSTPISFSYRGEPGWLMVVHQVHYSCPRKYLHRLVWLRQDWQEIFYGSAFFFRGQGIEYCTGFLRLAPEIYLLGYSRNDGATEFLFLNQGQIEQLLPA